MDERKQDDQWRYFASAPNFILAAIIFIIFLFIASAVKSIVKRFSLRRRRRQSLGLLLGRLAQVTVVVLGFLIALSTVAPSFHASDLVKMLGIGSVAIGLPSRISCKISSPGFCCWCKNLFK